MNKADPAVEVICGVFSFEAGHNTDMDIFYNIAVPYMFFPLLGLFLSAGLTCGAIRLLPRLKMVDIPRGRHQHENIVPRGGGIAVGIAFFTVTALLLCFFSRRDLQLFQELQQFLRNFSLPAAVILAVGLLDDKFELRSYVKLTFQVLAALMFYFEGCGIALLFGYELPIFLSLPITVLWCVTIINAFNLIDGVDGVAAGLGGISSFLLAAWSAVSGYNDAMVLILLCFGMSCLGFLRYNFAPAKIFMGDTGSMFIGLFFAYVSMQYSTKSVTFTALMVPLAAVGVPIYDVFLAVWRRTWRRYVSKNADSNIMQGDHDHLHHRILKETGRSGKTALIIYGLSLTLSLLAMVTEFLRTSFPTLVFVVLLVAIFAMIRYSNIELYDTLTSVARGVDVPHRNFLFAALHPALDALLVLLALFICHHVYGSKLLSFSWGPWWYLLFLSPFVLVLCFSGIYRTFWLRAGILQYYRLTRLLITAGTAGYVLNGFIWHYFMGIGGRELFSASGYYLVFWMMAAGFILAERFLLHYYESFGYRRLFIRNQGKHSPMPRVLIYGGGLSCRMYVSCMYCNFGRRGEAVKIAGIMDDNPALKNLNIYGFKVYGGIREIEYIYRKNHFDRIVIACDDLAPENLEKLKKFCAAKNIELKKFICTEQ